MKKGQRARRLEVPYGTDHSTNRSGSRGAARARRAQGQRSKISLGDGSRAGSAGSTGQGLKGLHSVAGIAK